MLETCDFWWHFTVLLRKLPFEKRFSTRCFVRSYDFQSQTWRPNLVLETTKNGSFTIYHYYGIINWAVLRDEQMSNGWQFSLLNDEQMSNKVGVEHQAAKLTSIFRGIKLDAKKCGKSWRILPLNKCMKFGALSKPRKNGLSKKVARNNTFTSGKKPSTSNIKRYNDQVMICSFFYWWSDSSVCIYIYIIWYNNIYNPLGIYP